QSFVDAKQTQWTAFRNRIRQPHAPASLTELTTSLEQFLLPVVSALSSGKPFPANWAAPGPWS
ncbi:MAG: nucleotidyl transferase AbiEii/AbiGii toxin family protein, partial [Chloroflexota bacterium]|nr:nucleotidyl transferase AbiEii/AbiGii toxin family protein [Chloroflexota bacterium]